MKNEEYEIPVISEHSGAMPCISPKWTWMYDDFDGELCWLMTPEIKPFNSADLLFVMDSGGIRLYASTYGNEPVELWSASGQMYVLAGAAAIIERDFPQIAAEYYESLRTIPLWMAQDPEFQPEEPQTP